MARMINLTRGHFAIVDDEDFNKINQYKWHYLKSRDGQEYAKRSGTKIKTQYLHRFIMGEPKEKYVDHYY
jgi:hypothetical protein